MSEMVRCVRKKFEERGVGWQFSDSTLRAALLAALGAADGAIIRAAILNARSGDGQELLRSDMPWCAPEASAGLIGAAVIRALRNEVLSPQAGSTLEQTSE